ILPNDGKLSITINGNINNIYIQVYDVNGTSLLYSQYTSGPNSFTYTKNDLVAGTYYVLNRSYYTNEYSTYQLVTEYISNNNSDNRQINMQNKGL
nr:hypothetical protein [Bacteroidota bacterium]